MHIYAFVGYAGALVGKKISGRLRPAHCGIAWNFAGEYDKLEKIVEGLNKAGFSHKGFRLG